MNDQSVYSYLEQINNYCKVKNGNHLAKQLFIPIAIQQQQYQQDNLASLVLKIKKINIISYCESNLFYEYIAGIVANRLQALVCLEKNELDESK